MGGTPQRDGWGRLLPGLGQSTAPAKAVCEGCEVRTECLGAVLPDQRTPGVWGGLSERQRAQLRRGAA
jgi:WhiB family transcriptional regulator, redox-sensing transcriptional regulator